MMLVCPSCDSRYMIGDDAIGPQGRKVRCANCGHEWFQEPEGVDGGSDLPQADLDAEISIDDIALDALASEEIETEDITNNEDDDMSISGEAEEEIALPSSDSAQAVEEDIEIAVAPSGDDTDPDAPVDGGEDIPDAVKPLPEDQDMAIAAPDEKTPFNPDMLKARLTAYAAAVLIFICILGVLVALKGPIFKAYPPSALLYTVMGLDVEMPGDGLVIEKLSAVFEMQGEEKALKVTGRVINLKRAQQDVPYMMATLRTEDGTEGQSWLIEPPFQVLAGEQSFEFETSMSDLTEETYSVGVKFAPFAP